jgi:arabinofuranan 3-O-arabinosyltransferase
MREAAEPLGNRTGSRGQSPRLLGIFASWRLQAYGYTLAAFYAACLMYVYCLGLWLVNSTGAPLYHDFTNIWVAATQAVNGQAASVFDQAAQMRAQEALVGTGKAIFSTWPYPPTYLLFLAPLGLFSYVVAFLVWQLVTLLAYVIVTFLIVRRREVIALVLASPFTICNILTGQSGFLGATLLGASLLLLERRPALAGLFIGCLTYKPQFGIVLPLALAAAGQWRTFASATATTLLLAGASIAAFGTGAWAALPRELVAQADGSLFGGPSNQWGYFQTVYGLIRYLHGGPALAWLAQGATTFSIAVIVSLIWASRVSYPLKAALLSAGALIATPYAFDYDLAAIAVPVAFLAKDQIRRGLLRGEQTIAVVLFIASLTILPAGGRIPVGALILLTLVYLILRRTLYFEERSDIFRRKIRQQNPTVVY